MVVVVLAGEKVAPALVEKFKLRGGEKKTAFQLEVLEKTYDAGQYPSVELRGELSKQLGLSDRQLQMWFCHKRLEEKKLQPEKQSRKGGVLVMMVSGEGLGGNEVGGSGGSVSGSSPFGHGERGVSRAGGPVVSGSVSGSRRVVVAASSEMPSVKMYYESPQVVSDARAVAIVEAQLGERLRDNGPILGMEFDPLLNGAFGAPLDMSNGNSGNKGRTRATVWDYFEKITGDVLPKTRCKICNKVYRQLRTSSMSRHLSKCYPQPITQGEPLEPVPHTDTVMSLSNDELSNEAVAAKILKSSLVENVGNKTDRELLEFILMNKQNVGILEQKFPEKAVAIKEAIKCYEDEIERRARFQRAKENGRGPITCTTPVKAEVDNDMVEDGIAVRAENTETHEDLNKLRGKNRSTILTFLQEKTGPQVDNIKLAIKVEEGEQYVSQNESIDRIIAEEERAGTFQSVPVNGDKNQASTQDICAELDKVSCVLSMLSSSPNKFYTPQGDPLGEEAEKAKQTLIQLLLGKNFETIVGVLKEWQEKDTEMKSKIETVEDDILQLKAELREKELTRESLVKEKSDLFDQSKMSLDEAEKLLQEMVTVKLQRMLL